MKIANRKTVIMLVSMVSLPVIQSTNAAPVVATATAQKLSTEERTQLAQLITLAGLHATQLSGQLHAFFDTKRNKETYGAHVQKFFEILVSVDTTIVVPLKTALETTTHNEYKALLEQVLGIIMDLRENLVDAHRTFKRNEGKGFLAVSTALGNLKDKVGTRLPHLEKMLKELQTTLLGFDTELAQEIDKLQKSLPTIFDIKLSNMVVVTRVKQRLDY